MPHLPYPVYQLPPVRCAADDFTALIDETGEPVTGTWRSHRRECLLDRLFTFRPDVLILETFPFGRRQMRFELMPLLAAARSVRRRPLIASSVRDVLQKRRPQRMMETVSLLTDYFDKVLVHGDPAFIGLEESFPMASEVQDKITYTGYIAEYDESEQSADTNGAEEVLISAGGGAVGRRLMLAAVAARSLSKLRMRRWRFLIGPGLPEAELRAIKARADGDIVFEAVRDDFQVLLRRCAVSVSQGGYNTVVDVLRSGARSVIVPFTGGGQTEQAFRARRLHQCGYVLTLDEAELTPQVLAETIDRASNMTPSTNTINLEGAANSAKYLLAARACGLGC